MSEWGVGRQQRKIMHISWPYTSAHIPSITHQMFTTVKNVMNRSCRGGQNKSFMSNTVEYQYNEILGTSEINLL